MLAEQVKVFNYQRREGDFFKINGFRIEGREIINVLEGLPGVLQACLVQAKSEDDNSAPLIAWLKTNKGTAVMAASEIRYYLSQQLSHYMIPGYFFFTDVLPVTLNGKVDIKKLALLSKDAMAKLAEIAHNLNLVNKKDPKHPAMKILRGHISDADFNTDSNFFDYGLSSLQAITLHIELMALYPNLELYELFDRPTCSSLIERFENAEVQ